MGKVVGVLAHVDAGKTTFSEQVLLHTGVLRQAGRVDHGDSFMDRSAVERERGITVFADQAIFDYQGSRYFWLDTPGHADLCAETEHVIPILDYAIVIISCCDGVESHTETLWQLLDKHQIPTLLFINKCDRPDSDRAECMRELKTRLSSDICDMTGLTGTVFPETAAEMIAERDDTLLEAYLSGEYSDAQLYSAAKTQLKYRRIFPAFFGSALKDQGVSEFLDAMAVLTDDYACDASLPFSARAFKVRTDDRGTRRLYMRILSGSVAVRDSIAVNDTFVQIGEMSLCHGSKYLPIKNALAGDIVCVNGMPGVRVGDGLGSASGTHLLIDSIPLLETCVSAGPEISKTQLLQAMKQLEDEDPSLAVRCTSNGEICIRIMGTIETEIIHRMVHDRFSIDIQFSDPRVVYTETVQESGIGIGHYEPLRHYAEVWVKVSPAPRSSGISFTSKCHVDTLALNWQRLIETHVFERTYPGVLIGAPLTDVRIELLAGRAHPKHTEGGDFREATCRAIRCALMNAVNLLLEPVVRIKLRFAEEHYGRILGDLHGMYADTDMQESRADGFITLETSCLLRDCMNYPVTFRALTHGRGTMTVMPSGYAPARDPAFIVTQADYNPRAEDTPDSVFCSHGAGHLVRWDEAPVYAHCAQEAISNI